MSTGFGRVLIDGVEQDDPYVDRLDDLEVFQVISITGKNYRVRQSRGHRERRWQVIREDVEPLQFVGSVVRQGSFLSRSYLYFREGHTFSVGSQSLLINAVFGLIE